MPITRVDPGHAPGDPLGHVDEIVASNVTVHLEDMGDWYYLGIGDQQFAIAVHRRPFWLWLRGLAQGWGWSRSCVTIREYEEP